MFAISNSGLDFSTIEFLCRRKKILVGLKKNPLEIWNKKEKSLKCLFINRSVHCVSKLALLSEIEIHKFVIKNFSRVQINEFLKGHFTRVWCEKSRSASFYPISCTMCYCYCMLWTIIFEAILIHTELN